MFYTYKKMAKELTATEIRTLIRGHNKMSQIKVPSGLNKDGLIKFLKSRKYKVDHVKKRLVDLTTGNSRGRITTLATAKDITKPKPKTDAQKQKAVESKAKKDEAKAKERKLAKKEGVKEFKQKKAEATKKPAQKKPTPKPKPPMKKESEVRKARAPYPTIPPNVKGKRIPKGQLLLQDKKKDQVVKKPVKVSMKDKLIAKDKKAESDEKKAIKQRKEDKKPYQPTADSELKEQMFKLNDYFVKDKNKIGKTFKTLKEVNDAIGKLFKAVSGGKRGEDQLEGLDTSERKYFIKLMNNMLRFSTKEKTGIEVTPRALQQYKGLYNPSAATEARETERKKEAAPARLEKKLLKAGSQLEDKPAIRAREKAEKEKVKAKAKAKATAKAKPIPEKSVTFDYEEVSGHSDALKKALKQTYDKANSIVNEVLSLKPKDFVENEQMSKYRMEQFNDDLNEDDDEIYDPIYEELDQGVDTKLREIQMKNREETNWVKAKPALKPMQDKYVKFMKKFKADNAPADFQAAKRQKDLILKHYKESDVPTRFDKLIEKPKFKIDQSKQPKQTPSKVDIKIKPESNTKKVEAKEKEEKDLVYYIKNNEQPFPDLALDIKESDNRVFMEVSAGDRLQGQYASQGRSASTATRLINQELKKTGFEIYFDGKTADGGLPRADRDKDVKGKKLFKLFNEYRDKNDLTTPKAWKRIVKLADKFK